MSRTAAEQTNPIADTPVLLASMVSWPLTGRAVGSPWRLVAAAGAVTEAISHVPLLTGTLSSTPYLGVGFLLLAVAGFLLTLLLVINDTLAVWASTVVVSALALIGYVLSRTSGLPQAPQFVGHWSYPLGIVSIVGEAMMLLPGLLYLPRFARELTAHASAR